MGGAATATILAWRVWIAASTSRPCAALRQPAVATIAPRRWHAPSPAAVTVGAPIALMPRTT
eukprot:7336941-Prymnesium_polylepis.2